jgi:type IV pilus assembly protein PilO
MALTLEGKPWYWGAIVGAVLAVGIVFAIHYFVVTKIDQRITSLNGELDELSRKIEAGRAAEKKLPQFRDEVRKLEQELEKFRLILPSSRNTEQIIKKLKTLVDQGDFNLQSLVFPKLAASPQTEFYTEWPITVRLEGSYHDLALLFDRLSKFSRIMNVEEFSITARNPQTDHTIAASFVAKTFVYIEGREAATAAGTPGGTR